MKSFIPKPLLDLYHRTLSYLGPILYSHPSRDLFVIGITGTKGKSTTAELVAAILTAASYKVAVASTIRFSIAGVSEPNKFKMTMPGRFFLQSFLRKAVDQGATHAVVEMTSEGAVQHRHKGIDMDALVFINLAPEHIESHGSLENYIASKLSIAHHLARSPKRPRIIVANADDEVGKKFLETHVEVRAPFSLKDAEPYSANDTSLRFVWKRGELFTVPMPGMFNLQNVLAAMALADAMGIPRERSKYALEHMGTVSGRAERVEKGQPFTAIVDYAHTPESLEALYQTFSNKRLICVLGSTGGGRDKAKRPILGALAEKYCDMVFLTDEDPYDEDPRAIVEEIAKGLRRKKSFIIMDRRAAIREALKEAKEGDAVLVTGKGTDPYIMRAGGAKEPWSDKRVVEEELMKLGYH